jgi:hypothetical protein
MNSRPYGTNGILRFIASCSRCWWRAAFEVIQLGDVFRSSNLGPKKLTEIAGRVRRKEHLNTIL